ncbi:MAG TPA: Ca2+-dependent phosphoinositide-specific phospholipase C [Candidatus Deferrimicrobium sp.]|nr:Ca2+-dependent phosphoinositide-specific phospholipase C [Candidatus Deferrimicrobium sp.]
MSEFYNKSVFMATHNSYSGGVKKSIRQQLDGNIRGLELDIHSDEIETKKYFEVGHVMAGSDVDHHDNPKSIQFVDWLKVIKDWSNIHVNHVPITLFIDIKHDLVHNPPGYGPEFLNRVIFETFEAARLYTPKMHRHDGTDWPPLDELKGKILVVLTGDTESKWAY